MTENIIKILIVDDHQIMIDGIKSILNNENDIIVVGHANNGNEAIELLNNINVDVILMDVEMPVMNGIDATTIIHNKFPEIKIIALTTYDEKSIINTMINAGANGYILKNINRDILVQAIKTVASGKIYYGSDIKIALAKDNLYEKKHTNNLVNPDDYELSKREFEILKYIVNGLSSKEIAEKIFLSPKTIDTHRNNIMRKLEVHNIASLVKKAIKLGLID